MLSVYNVEVSIESLR